MKKIYFLILGVFALSFNSYGQGRLKFGIGYNFIANNYELEELQPYLAFSGHLSYRLYSQKKFSLNIETNSSYRLKYNDANDVKSGLVVGVPVTGHVQLNKITLYGGAGVAYLRQKTTIDNYAEKLSGYFVNYLTGVAWKGRAIIPEVLYPEYNIRISFYDDFRQTKHDAYAISLIVFLRGQ